MPELCLFDLLIFLLFTPHGQKFRICSNISYAKTKLGLLSLLWRSSITSSEFFANIKLESSVEEDLRKMIYNSDPKENSEYPIITLKHATKSDIISEMICEPRKFEIALGSGYTLMIGGYTFIFYIKHNFSNEELIERSITMDGSMTIHKYSGEKAKDWFTSYLNI